MRMTRHVWWTRQALPYLSDSFFGASELSCDIFTGSLIF
jgi:hypothetical protein